MPPPHRVLLVRPGHAGGVAGNDQTAERWRRQLLALPGQVERVLGPFDPNEALPLDQDPTLLVALHAHKSARAVEAFHGRYPDRPILVALGGTDAYDPAGWSPEASASLDLAGRILCFHELLIERLERPGWRTKAIRMRPSAEPIPALERAAACPPPPPFRALLLANLRAVKGPLLAALAARQLDPDLPLTVEHYGQTLEPALEAELAALPSPHFRFLGPLTPLAARAALTRAHLLINTSLSEGASNALVEALASGIPILATKIPGNQGLLGDDYPGLFPPADASALTEALTRFATEARFRAALTERCQALAPLHQPAAELAAWRTLLDGLPVETTPG